MIWMVINIIGFALAIITYDKGCEQHSAQEGLQYKARTNLILLVLIVADIVYFLGKMGIINIQLL